MLSVNTVLMGPCSVTFCNELHFRNNNIVPQALARRHDEHGRAHLALDHDPAQTTTVSTTALGKGRQTRERWILKKGKAEDGYVQGVQTVVDLTFHDPG